MGYNWGIQELLQARKQLLDLQQSTSGEEKKQQIQMVLDSLEAFIEEERTGKSEEIPTVDYNGRFEVIEESIATQHRYYSLVRTFFDVLSQHRDKIDILEEQIEEKIGLEQSFGVVTGATISHDKAFSLTSFFYKKHFPNLYPLFAKAYEQRFHSVRFVPSLDGECVANSTYLWFIDRYFINAIDDVDISKLFNLIHEYGHILQYTLKPQALFCPTNSMFDEVASLFPEMVARYENDGHFDETQILFEEYVTLANLFGHSTNIVLHSPFVNLWKEHQKDVDDAFLDELEEYYETDVEMLDDALDTYIDDQGMYIVSYMVAIELLHIYKKDKEKALSLYEKILRIPYEEDIDAAICELLPLGEHLEEEAVQIIDGLAHSLKKVNHHV